MPESDAQKRAALLSLLRDQNGGGSAEGAVVDALVFLDGNEDEGSIGGNLPDHPGVGAFREAVARVAARPDVAFVHVCIQDDLGDDYFPYTDAILVCTSADPQALQDEFEVLSPDDIFPTDDSSQGKLPDAPPGHRWLSVWWD